MSTKNGNWLTRLLGEQPIVYPIVDMSQCGTWLEKHGQYDLWQMDSELWQLKLYNKIIEVWNHSPSRDEINFAVCVDQKGYEAAAEEFG